MSEYVIKANDGTSKGSTALVVNFCAFIVKDLNIGKIIPEESFSDAYVEEVD